MLGFLRCMVRVSNMLTFRVRYVLFNDMLAAIFVLDRVFHMLDV